MNNYNMTTKLAYFGNTVCDKKDPNDWDAPPVMLFSNLVLEHFGPGLEIVKWGQKGVTTVMEVRDMVLNHPVDYDMAVVFHHWQFDCDMAKFHKAQRQIYKYFAGLRLPVLHCWDMDPRFENLPAGWGDVTTGVLKLQRLTKKTRNFVGDNISINNIDQSGNWNIAKIIVGFIEQNKNPL